MALAKLQIAVAVMQDWIANCDCDCSDCILICNIFEDAILDMWDGDDENQG